MGGQFRLRPAYVADLGDGIYADGHGPRYCCGRLVKSVVRGQPSLLHGGGRERGKTDHVAHGVYVAEVGAIVLVYRYAPSFVGRDPDSFEVKAVGGALAARRVHDDVGRHCLAAAEKGHRAAVVHLHRLDNLAEPEGDRQVPEVELQRLDDLLVTKVEHPVALLDDRDLGAERGKDRRVLDANDTGTDYHQ